MKKFLKIEKDGTVYFVCVLKDTIQGRTYKDVCIYKESNFLFIKFKKLLESCPIQHFFLKDFDKNSETYYVDIANAAVDEYVTKLEEVEYEKMLEKKHEVFFENVSRMQKILK